MHPFLKGRYPLILGMDFGTTHSGMAHFDGRQLRPIPLNPLDPNDRVTPTMLYITNEQQVTFGRAAMNAYFEQNLGRPSKMEKVWVGEITQTFAELPTFVRDVYIWVDVLSPGRLFVSFKTDLSDASYAGTAIGRFFYSLEDIATAYLYIAKRRAEQVLGHPVEAIVLGRPVRFHDNPEADRLAQARLLEAALQAGYRQVYFEYEPIAAAHYYEMSMTGAQNVLVFDFGGGTLDITVMRLGDPRQRQVLATGGVPIAGDLFDRKIVRAKIPHLFGEGSYYRSLDKKLPLPGWVYDAFNDWRTLLTLQQPEQIDALRTIAPTAEKRREIEALIKLVTSNYSLKLFEVVEGVKRRLSERDEAVIRLQGDGFFIREPITRREFEQLIRPEYNIIEQHLDETVRSSGLRADEIDVVIRTGGSSQIPMFQRLLAQKFGAEKVQAIDTFGSVTAGLGVIAHRIARGEIDKPVYTRTTRLQPLSSAGQTHIPPINLDLLKQQLAWQERSADNDEEASPPALAFLSKEYQLAVVEPSTGWLTSDKPVPRSKLGALPAAEPLALLSAGLDEPLLLMTSGWRLLLVTMRDLLHQRAAGLTLAELYGFDRGEQICQLRRWSPVRMHEQLILVSTQGYARRFEMAQLRPLIEGPTPARIDWSLPGWPRLALGVDEGQDVALVTAAGRALRLPATLVRRTGTRLLQKQKIDEIIGGQAVTAIDWLWLLTSEGCAKWLCASHIPAGVGGEQGALVVRRRGPLCGLLAEEEAPVRLLTTEHMIPVDPHRIPREDSLSMHRVVKLGKGDQVLGIVQVV
jgi:hypothetical chaperone protein